MSATTFTLLLAGAANLLPALFFMFTALVGSNGMNSAQGGQLLGTLAVLLVLGWLAALWLARHLAHWGQARGWSTVASVAAASGGAVATFTVLALLSTLVALLWVGA
ncbi:hypothetical protein [Acidovorax kalamii]|mgnify:FL=1|jgi:CBS domain containing-hemolysin-like protein|uniref:hypothetical protein n=1 Tax=Acidovorax kalamii TaxID=2004485 RepID=UPI002090201B|nr:hypothetical protein [Acidovorax kalamii]MCO5357377.1 hypothetical protein [Acidovorax kalamii]